MGEKDGSVCYDIILGDHEQPLKKVEYYSRMVLKEA